MAKKKPGRPASGRPVVSSDGRVTEKFVVRLDEALRAPLEAAAKRNERSVTAEVQYRIRESLEREAKREE